MSQCFQYCRSAPSRSRIQISKLQQEYVIGWNQRKSEFWERRAWYLQSLIFLRWVNWSGSAWQWWSYPWNRSIQSVWPGLTHIHYICSSNVGEEAKIWAIETYFTSLETFWFIGDSWRRWDRTNFWSSEQQCREYFGNNESWRRKTTKPQCKANPSCENSVVFELFRDSICAFENERIVAHYWFIKQRRG